MRALGFGRIQHNDTSILRITISYGRTMTLLLKRYFVTR